MEDKELFEKALKSYEETKEKVNTFTGTFEELCKELNGWYFDGEMFNCNIPYLCLTIHNTKNGLEISNFVELWNDDEESFVDYFNIEDLYKLVKGE